MPYFHVRLQVWTDDEDVEDLYEFDLSEDEARLLGSQYYDGRRVLFKGKWFDSSKIEEVEIRKTPKRAEEYTGFFSGADENIFDGDGEDVTRAYLTASVTKRAPRSLGDKVFVVHGRDKQSSLELARILEREFGLTAILQEEQAQNYK